MPHRIQTILSEITNEITRDAAQIEAAADAQEEGLTPGGFGIAMAALDGNTYSAGDAKTSFPIQSIAKVFTMELALDAIGHEVFERVGREPSGDPFNSIVELERTCGIPRNPFVNAGALVVVDILTSTLDETVRPSAVLHLVERQVGKNSVHVDDAVLATEQDGGDLNRAMLSFMRRHGNVYSDPDLVMAAYVEQCAIALDCRGLATAGLFLARTALDGDTLDRARATRMRELLALMMTCGHYDGSGDFALRVGLPAKSGVGGGILAIVPEIGAVATWSPNLDQHGNSMLGVRALEMLAYRTGWSVFGSPLAD